MEVVPLIGNEEGSSYLNTNTLQPYEAIVLLGTCKEDAG
jgi:hypothetical protein